ncbi:MAG: putative acetyltransferase EpsM [Alphaproteobacteria bacterium MarineAlpha5_Bin11]|nr:MAG: putative acetyltransferase EpsM [Alphaproteobacteria bacterium MarineAlpha5_Bin11]PPR51280.1 MAG: putative acetyltransferase EpsM [Alphaproteobacteria bacterium MarineAlpha5_Bin10]
MKKKILIFGASGQAKVTFDIIKRNNIYDVAGFVAKGNKLKTLLGYPVYNSEEQIKKLNINDGIVAIGDNNIRYELIKKIYKIKKNFNFINAIHPSAIISDNVNIGIGIQIMAGVIINSSSSIGDHCIINTNSNIDHDCKIANFSSINPGVSIGGNVTIGDFTLIGIGSSVIHKIVIGKNSVIGAHSNVVKNIPSKVVAYGNPCAIIRKNINK